MTRIEKVVKEVSDLRDFYIKIQKRKKLPSRSFSQKPEHPKSSSLAVEEEKRASLDSD